MISTILAVIIVAYALGFALFVLKSRKEQREPQAERKRLVQDFVTRDEMDAAIEKATRDLEYMANDYYEKFNALHQRLAKREKRAAAPDEQISALPDQGRPAPPSVARHYLKRG